MLDPIIDICVRIGVNTTELESLVRVEFVQRLAETLPGNLRRDGVRVTKKLHSRRA